MLILVLISSCMSHEEEGILLFEKGDYKGAEFHFARALKLDRNNWKLIYNLARSKEELEKFLTKQRL